MKLRTRLVVVTAAAVIIAILGASLASYISARNALLGSVDGTLVSTAGSITSHRGPIPADVGQAEYQYVSPSGTILSGGSLPVSQGVKTVAQGNSPSFYADITVQGTDYREYVMNVGPVLVQTPGGGPAFTTRAALELVIPLNAVDTQLSDLGLALILVALGGVAVALVLAWIVSRMSLIPLDDLAASVEDVAATTDVSRRLDPGGADELGRLRRAFNHLLSALEKSREAQRQLVLDAGHELRTPLTSLRTNLEVVRRLDELTESDKTILIDDVLTQLGELTTLVGDLSELARGERSESESEPLRLDMLVEDAVTIARSHGRPHGIAVYLTSSPTPVTGRRDRMARAIGNLLDNALKWAPSDSVVEVTCRTGTLIVRDHGPGIEDPDLPHIFDRFYRAPSARSLPGSGLGLAIVAQVAESEGGTVGVRNAVGGGAEFRLSFPMATDDPIEVDVPTETVRTSGIDSSTATSRAVPTPDRVNADPGDLPSHHPPSTSSMRFPNGSST